MRWIYVVLQGTMDQYQGIKDQIFYYAVSYKYISKIIESSHPLIPHSISYRMALMVVMFEAQNFGFCS